VAVTLIFAHRGLHTSERENTVEAFRAAGALGVDGVELDVRRSADALLVVHHDPAVAGRALAATASTDLPPYIPTLTQALHACAGLRVNVEIKNIEHPTEPTYDATGEFARQVVDLLSQLGWTGSVVVSSFDLATCRAVRDADPALLVGWLLLPGSDVVARAAAARDDGFHAVHPHYRSVDRTTVEAAHAMGLAVNVWTVNRPEDIAAMLELGVDYLTSDDPATALALADRPSEGRWPMA
jgi:glycerophosphoryl diester phosphodiesterase